ncbi:MAG: EamA family transporter [Acidiferrobacteraceae bacterium]|nr:EamA family transporter [Acidiferrobacteraceae bacterium]|tara:strand:- start:52649 stop:53527 length:879 start_codon:yes stop_codon:yes gene_type:complete
MIWGSTWIAITLQIGTVSPEISLVYRFAISALLLFIFCGIRRIELPIGWRIHGLIIILGFCLFGFNYFLFYLAADRITSGLLAVIFSTITVMNILNSALFLNRLIEVRIIFGSVVGLVGIILVFLPEVRGTEMTSDVVSAVILGVIATYLASVGNIVSAHIQKIGVEVIPSNALGMLYGTLILLFYSIINNSTFNFDLSFGYVSSLAYLSLFGSALAFTLYLTLVGKIGPAKAAYATVLFPIVALTLSTMFENYTWSSTASIGVILVLSGNIIVITTHTQTKQLIKKIRDSF